MFELDIFEEETSIQELQSPEWVLAQFETLINELIQGDFIPSCEAEEEEGNYRFVEEKIKEFYNEALTTGCFPDMEYIMLAIEEHNMDILCELAGFDLNYGHLCDEYSQADMVYFENDESWSDEERSSELFGAYHTAWEESYLSSYWPMESTIFYVFEKYKCALLFDIEQQRKDIKHKNIRGILFDAQNLLLPAIHQTYFQKTYKQDELLHMRFEEAGDE